MSESDLNSGRRMHFATTHWSLVISATTGDADASRSALEWLCQAYWMPLYAYIRRRIANEHDAQDLTQAFFERLLEKDYLANADPNRGRFRSFLLTAFKHFLANEWDKRKATKRGGGKQVLSLDFSVGNSLHASLPTEQVDAEKIFERQWANTILTRVMQQLEREQERSGNARQFDRLKHFIGGRPEGTSLAVVAPQLEMTESAARMAVSRLRARFRDLLRAEIAETVTSSDAIDEEIAHLFSVFSA